MKQRSLRGALEGHPRVLLRAIAAAHGLEDNEPAETLVERLEEHLQRPETVEHLLQTMAPEARQALDYLLAEGGQMPSHRFQRHPLGGELRQLGPGAMEREQPWDRPASATETLFYLGLVYLDFGAAGEFRGQVLYVPTELLSLLPQVDQSPVTFAVPPLSGLPPGVREGSLDLVEDAFVVLSDLQRHTVHAVRGRYLPPDALQRINGRLRHPEPNETLNHERETQRLALLMHLLRALQLVEESEEGLLRPVTARARRWLQLPRTRRLLSLQRAWADDPLWNDLWRIPSLRPERTGWRNDPQRARAALVRWLRQISPGTWYGIADFIRAIKAVDPDFQRPDGDYQTWFIRHAETKQLLTGWENWEQVEGTLLRYYFVAPLAWLAIVDLGYLAPSDKQPFGFRLTPYGARWLGQPADLPSQPARRPMVVAADGRVTVPPGADDWERLHLERLSVPVTEGPGDYLLDRDRVIALLMEGSDVERVLRFLDHTTNNLLPEAVRKRLREWAGEYGRIILDRLVVMEVDDARLLRDLQQRPEISRYFDRPLGPRAIVVREGALPALIEALRGAGHLPRVRVEGHPRPTPPPTPPA